MSDILEELRSYGSLPQWVSLPVYCNLLMLARSACSCLIVQVWKKLWRILVFVVFVTEHFVLSINLGCVHKLFCRVPSPSV
jgi:hypothetical protein